MGKIRKIKIILGSLCHLNQDWEKVGSWTGKGGVMSGTGKRWGHEWDKERWQVGHGKGRVMSGRAKVGS